MECQLNNKGIEIESENGYSSFYAISKQIKDTLKFDFDNGTSLKVSKDHKFFIDGKKVEAIDVAIGDFVDTKNGNLKVLNITENGPQEVYCPIQVHDNHKYVTDNKVINGNCQFIGSTSTLVVSEYLDKMNPIDPIEYKYGYALKIWEEPIPGQMYVMGVDSASGTGLDYATIQVWKLESKERFVQVACYHNNTIEPGHFSRVVVEVSKWYNEALMILENNEIGGQVANEVWFTLLCGNILNTDKHGIGTRATKTSKLEACIELKRLIEHEILVLNDIETIKEISRFEEVSPNVFKGPKDGHDDLVSASYWAAYCAMQPQIDLDNLEVIAKPEEEAPARDTFFDDSEMDEEFLWSDL